MKIWIKILLGITLSLCCVFCCVGYAAISNTLSVQGDVDVKPPYEIFISSIDSDSSVGASTAVNSFIHTVANLSVSLANESSSFATFHVTIYNNTVDYYAFKGIHYNEDGSIYDNPNIIFDFSGIEIGDKVSPEEFVYIDVTFHYDSYKGVAEKLNAVLEFHFGLSGEEEGTDYESYINSFLTNMNGYGLNDTHKKGEEVLNNLEDHGLLFANDNLKGGNLKHLLEAINSTQTENLTFVYKYVSETEVILYTYEEKYNSSTYQDQQITAYKTTFSRESVGSSYTEWTPSNSYRGLATVKNQTTPAGTTLYAIDINTWNRIIMD